MRIVIVLLFVFATFGCQVARTSLPGNTTPAPATVTPTASTTPEAAPDSSEPTNAKPAKAPVLRGKTAPDLYEEGKAAFMHKDLATAMAAFKKAASIDHQPNYYYNVCAVGYAMLAGKKHPDLAESARFYCHYAGVYMTDKKKQDAAFSYSDKLRAAHLTALKKKDRKAFDADVIAAVHAIYGDGLMVSEDTATKQMHVEWGEVTADKMQHFIRDYYEPGIGAHVLVQRDSQVKLCFLVASFMESGMDYESAKSYCTAQWVLSYLRPKFFFDGETATSKPLATTAKVWLPRPDGTYAVNVAIYGKRPSLSNADKIKLLRYLSPYCIAGPKGIGAPGVQMVNKVFWDLDKSMTAVKKEVLAKKMRKHRQITFTTDVIDEYAVARPLQTKTASCKDISVLPSWPAGNDEYAIEVFANGKSCDEFTPRMAQNSIWLGSCPKALKEGRNRIKARMSQVRKKHHRHLDSLGRLQSSVEDIPVKTLVTKSITCVVKQSPKEK
ncbi:MAG TPA: hypothetical protein VFG83_01470 [Kofleriaceae bacterium]|nr:hypothetical protein [Kofleriaceae bacterium]